jgi:hypothetical protein
MGRAHCRRFAPTNFPAKANPLSAIDFATAQP